MTTAIIPPQAEQKIRGMEALEYIDHLKSSAYTQYLSRLLGLDDGPALRAIQSEIVGAAESVDATWSIPMEYFFGDD